MNDDLPPLTHHGRARGKERAGLDRHALARMAGRALVDGVRIEETTGRLRRYLARQRQLHPPFRRFRIHGQHIFIFGTNDAVITVLELPHEHRRAARSALEKRAKKGGEDG